MLNLPHKIGFFLCSLSLILLLTSSTGQKSVDSENEWLPVNFYGVLIDTENNTDNIQNISISGEYRKIPFYIKPKKKETDPYSNYEKIDLSDIAEIKLGAPTPGEALYTYKKRDYIEVVVTFNKNKKAKALNSEDGLKEKNYIIERSKKIICYRVVNGKPILKQVNFESLSQLIIKGHKEQDEDSGPLDGKIISSE